MTLLQLDNLSCGYGAFTAVHQLDIDIDSGEVFALIGANGAGKSSTINAIAGHVRILGGRIIYDSTDITGLAVENRVRQGVALVPEGRRLFPDLSVDENLRVGGYQLAKGEHDGYRERVFTLFPRLADRLGQAAGSLSGGEQQMLAIARALMAAPRLLLIDELSLGLMPKMIDACYAALQTLKDQGLTILLVEQSTDRVLRIADRVAVLESGKCVWSGRADDAASDPHLIEAYLGLAEAD